MKRLFLMAAVIACILLSGEALSAFAITPATENLSWFKKKKKKNNNKTIYYILLYNKILYICIREY